MRAVPPLYRARHRQRGQNRRMVSKIVIPSPFASPRSSRRRRALINDPALATSAGATPTWRAAAIAIGVVHVMFADRAPFHIADFFARSATLPTRKRIRGQLLRLPVSCSPTAPARSSSPTPWSVFRLMSFSGQMMRPATAMRADGGTASGSLSRSSKIMRHDQTQGC